MARPFRWPSIALTGMDHDRLALYLCILGATTPVANIEAALGAAKTFGVD